MNKQWIVNYGRRAWIGGLFHLRVIWLKVILILFRTPLFQILPEGKIKNSLRQAGLTLTGFVPIDLIIYRGDTVVQVGGAGTEEEVFRLVKIVGKYGRVIVIVPEKQNLQSLREEIEKESLENIIVVPKGAWSEKGKQKLLISSYAVQHKIEIPGIFHPEQDLRPENYQGFTEIEVDTLDNMLRDLGIDSIDFIKITVNGAELEVLKGMEEILKGDLRLCVRGVALKDGKPISEEISQFLRDKGFNTRIVKSEDFVYARRP